MPFAVALPGVGEGLRMKMKLADAPDLTEASFDERWRGPDRGLIVAWTRGLAMRREAPETAEACARGELPVLPFKGGLEREIKAKKKVGALHYLAMWQGLRGEDLDIDPDNPPSLTCSKTGVKVEFTGDTQKLFKAV